MSYIQYYNGIRYITSNNTNTNTEYYRDVFISNYRAPVSLNFPANHVVDDRRTKQPIHHLTLGFCLQYFRKKYISFFFYFS